MYYKEAEPIIDALDAILRLLCKSQVTKNASGKRATNQADIDQDNDGPSPKRLRRLIGGAQHVVMNGKGCMPRSFMNLSLLSNPN